MSPNINEPPARDNVCYFFSLSGELRNRIYEYVLTESCLLRFRRDHPDDSGKFYRHETNRPSHQNVTNFTKALSDALLEANQLQYVNKQLRAETLGLGLQYNELSFLHVQDMGHFLQCCAPAHLGCLRTLAFDNAILSELAKAPEMPTIFRFCEKYPKALVKGYHFNQSPKQIGTLLYMCFEEYKLRGTHTLWSSTFAEGSEWLRKFKGLCFFKSSLVTWEGWQGDLTAPLNFRVYPSVRTFDETAFRAECKSDAGFQAKFLPSVAGGTENIVKLTKLVIVEGV